MLVSSINIDFIITLGFQYQTEIYYCDQFCVMEEHSSRYSEEVLRLLNEMVGLLKENNTMLNQHAKTVEMLNERVRKIGINTSSIR